jgi:hypothetical protein
MVCTDHCFPLRAALSCLVYTNYALFFLPSFLIVTQLAVVLVSLLRVGRGYYRQPTHRLSVFMLLATTILLIDKAPCNSRSYY